MANLTSPSVLASRQLGPMFDAADQAAHIAAEDVAAARISVDAIKAIPDVYFSPKVVAQIAAVLSARIAECSWAHFEHAPEAAALLDDAHDTLEVV